MRHRVCASAVAVLGVSNNVWTASTTRAASPRRAPPPGLADGPRGEERPHGFLYEHGDARHVHDDHLMQALGEVASKGNVVVRASTCIHACRSLHVNACGPGAGLNQRNVRKYSYECVLELSVRKARGGRNRALIGAVQSKHHAEAEGGRLPEFSDPTCNVPERANEAQRAATRSNVRLRPKRNKSRTK